MDQLPLRGRQPELQAIEQHLHLLGEGQGGRLLINGPPGSGKTRLLAELTKHAERRNFVVVSAACDELDRHAPMLPLLSALRAGPDPLLPRNYLDAAATDADRRFWFLERLRDTLEQQSRRQPLVILLDDLQWADAATLIALRTLPPRLGASAVLWALAHNPRQSCAGLERVLDRLLSHGAVQLSLGPLGAEDSLVLATDVLGRQPPESLSALIDDARGNPFLITELVRSAAEANAATEPGRATPAIHVPARFSRHIQRQLRELPLDARQLLEVGAVLGPSFTVDDAAGMLARPPGAMIGTLTGALGTGLVLTDQDRLSFRHTLIHRAVYDELPEALRVGLHREAARLLLRAGRPAREAVSHLLVTARTGDAEATGALLAAVTDMAGQSPEAAADLAVRSYELLAPDDPQRPGLLATVIELFTRTGRLGEARALAEEALSGPIPPKVEAAVRLAVSTGLNLSGDAKAAVNEAARALALPGLPDLLRADLEAAAGTALIQVRDVAGAERSADESLRLGRTLNIGPVTVSAMTLTSQIAFHRGRLAEALPKVSEAVQAFRRDPAARDRLPQLWLARVLLAGDRPGDAEGACREGEGVATEIGAAWSRPYWHLCRAYCRLECGRLAEAAREAGTGRSIAEELGLAGPASEAAGVLGQVAFHQGDLAAAEDHLRAAGLAAAGLALHPAARWVQVLLADANGCPDKALSIAFGADASTEKEPLAALLSFGITAIPCLVRIAVRAGRTRERQDLVAHARRLATLNHGMTITAGIAAHATGIAGRNPDELAYAAAAYRDTGRPLAAAMASEDLGRALLRAGDRTAAIVHLRSALTAAAEAGAIWHADRIRRRLRAAGVRHRFPSPRRQVAFGWGSLTDAELRVASLAAEGLTNQAIADRLFLSPHTVNTHLRHVFGKLGVNSRVGLTRLVLAGATPAAGT